MTSPARRALHSSVILGLLLAVGSASVVHAQDPIDGSVLDDRLERQEVFGFLPYWELHNADGIDLATVTTLAWFGLEAGRDGRLDPRERRWRGGARLGGLDERGLPRAAGTR